MVVAKTTTTVALAGLLAGAGAFWAFGRGPSSVGSMGSGAVRLSANYPEDVIGQDCLLSPSGETVVCAGLPKNEPDPDEVVSRLYVRKMDQFEMVPLEGVRESATSPSHPTGAGWPYARPSGEKATLLGQARPVSKVWYNFQVPAS